LDICAHAHKPVVFSHANAYAIHPHPRNITDEQIYACASTKGVICINGVGRFLGGATPDNFARHCAYIAEKVGVDHLGMGLDTMLDQAGITDMPEGITEEYWWPKEHYPNGIGGIRYLQPEDLPSIDQALKNIGFHAEERESIFWNNMMRVANECWD
jgi:membrane dipeptidase